MVARPAVCRNSCVSRSISKGVTAFVKVDSGVAKEVFRAKMLGELRAISFINDGQ